MIYMLNVPATVSVTGRFLVCGPFKSRLGPVGAAADVGAASWLAVAFRAEMLEGCCYVSSLSLHPCPSLSFSLSPPPSFSLLLARIPLNNPHLGQTGWEAIQRSAPLCRLRRGSGRKTSIFNAGGKRDIFWQNRKIKIYLKIFFFG